MQIVKFFILFFVILGAEAQIDSLHYRKKSLVVNDSIVFHNVSTNPYFFQLSLKNGEKLDKTTYRVDFGKSKVYLLESFYQKYNDVDSLRVQFYTYPDFLTKTYQGLDTTLILPNATNKRPIALDNIKKPLKGKPLSGLNTQGNIIRGVTIGNNQDAVVNSILDLKIEGKLSDKVALRARINDTNIPIQENGYSQDLKDIDRVYIELEGPQWAVKAGDVFLKDSLSHFMNFTKKVSGVAIETNTDKFNTFASGALVRGRFTEQQFQGQEANQGPYKLKGPNNEAYIFIINGSERIFINGVPQTRGEENDYTIDYNTAEITFTPTNPITTDMRISVEFQYSDRNYTRFVTHDAVQYKDEKWQIGLSFFNESDSKNQPLQLSLSDEQINLLSQAGNDVEQLFITNAVETEYDENKILYRLITQNGIEVYEYSTDATETLFQVGFTYMGKNLGDYQVAEYLAIGKKMEYVGENNGDYKAITPLVAPSKQQITVLNSSFKPNKKTAVSVEVAYSDFDQNLFSSIDNSSNRAPAMKASWRQVLLDSTKKGWHLESQFHFDYLDQKFKSIERIFAIEFDRDWNLDDKTGNQSLFDGKLVFSNNDTGDIFYGFENLAFSDNFNGNRQTLGANFKHKKLAINHLSSYLMSKGNLMNTQFTRSHSAIRYNKKNWWVGTHFDFENNQHKDKQADTLSTRSYGFIDVKALFGVGDTTKVYAEFGAQFHSNDSLVDTKLQRVNDSQTWFVNSQLLNAKNAQLKVYANYRNLSYKNSLRTEALNTRLSYNQQVFDQFVVLQTDYQNTSGNIPQQDYTYVETETGQGFYAWNDYNGNGLQELDEFEIAQFADEANFLRVALPNISYLPTQEARLQQNIQINFAKWNNKKAFKKVLSHFYNQFNLLTQSNKKKQGNLVNINPFDIDSPNVLNRQFAVRNSFIFNRGKSHYTSTYNYNNSQQKIVQSFDNWQNNLERHQVLFQHRIKEHWELGFDGELSQNSSSSEVFSNRNYRIFHESVTPSLAYFISKNHWVKTSYSYAKKNNEIGDLEALDQQQLALDYNYTNDKQTSFSVQVKALKNQFSGNNFSAVGYQMLEGLQPDNNMTWNLLWSKKINSFLYLNLNYNGRANEFSRSIHNGNVQLRAQF